jgi:hypothetical protein
MVQITSIAGASNQRITGAGVENIAFFGRTIADKGLEIINTKSGSFKNLYFDEFKVSGLSATGLPNIGEIGGACGNVFENISTKIATATGAGIHLYSDPTGTTNACLNTFTNTQILMLNGIGIRLQYADNNVFIRTFVYHGTGGTADAIAFENQVGAPIGAQANVFYGLTVNNKDGSGGNVHISLRAYRCAYLVLKRNSVSRASRSVIDKSSDKDIIVGVLKPDADPIQHQDLRICESVEASVGSACWVTIEVNAGSRSCCNFR